MGSIFLYKVRQELSETKGDRDGFGSIKNGKYLKELL